PTSEKYLTVPYSASYEFFKAGTSTSSTSSSIAATPTPTNALVCDSANQGSYYCIESGVSRAYEVCVNGAFMSGTCPTGTVCTTSGNSIVCNYPSSS
ncbi:hypothetical protein BZG36_05636, partial [Bifiguratus adelaidae]